MSNNYIIIDNTYKIMSKTTNTVPYVSTTQIQFVSGSYTLGVQASPSMTANVTFTFPPNTGPVNSYLQTDGVGNAYWGTGPYYPPIPNSDFYRGRTNQIISINTIFGVTGNTGGIDTPGGNFANPSNGISATYIVTPVKNGTLTATGVLGGYTYQSYPRFVGIDRFYYKDVDSLGITSMDTACCTISIEANGPMGLSGYSGGYFIYCSTGSTSVTQYSSGTETVLFNATYPGYSGAGPTGLCCLATNKLDNLIYYCAYTAAASEVGKIYAYDYVNNYQFLLANAATSGTNFSVTAGVNFCKNGACYAQKYLYIPCYSSSTTGYFEVSTNQYTYIGGTGTQIVLYASKVNYTNSFTNPTITYDYTSSRLIFCGNDGTTPTTERVSVVIPATGNQLYTATAANFPNRKLTIWPDNVLYTAVSGVTGVANFDVIGNTGYYAVTPISSTTISCMAEYPNQPVS